MTYRRIVTGLDDQGRSAIIFDGPSEKVAWATTEAPADNSGIADQGGAFSLVFSKGGSKFIMAEFPPNPGVLHGPGMHATDTIDYLAVIKGEVILVTETGEAVCRPGDVIVDRGIVHGWRNDGTEPALLSCVLIDASPVGNGATIK